MGDLGTFSLILIIASMIAIIAWIIALVDAIKNSFKSDNEKLVWILVILIGGIIGAILYFLIGKKNREQRY